MMRHIHIVDADPNFRASMRALLADRPDLIIRFFACPDAFARQADELDAGVLLLCADWIDVLRPAARAQAAIVLTSDTDVRHAVDAMKAGARDVLIKGCAPETLLGAIEDAFRHVEREAAAATRARAVRARIAALSPREADVLHGLIEGRPNKAIAGALAISPRTVEIHRANLMEKLGARSLPEALGVAFAAGLFATQ